jgi:phage-related holin
MYTSLFATKFKLAWAAILLGIEFFVAPGFSIFGAMLAVIALDFLTGIVKAKVKKEARTSAGFRKTVTKLMQYVLPVMVIAYGSKTIPENQELLTRINGWLMMFIIYIEVTSIFENLYEIDQKTVIAKYLYKYALIILKIGIENNPVVQAADKISLEENLNYKTKTENDGKDQ